MEILAFVLAFFGAISGFVFLRDKYKEIRHRDFGHLYRDTKDTGLIIVCPSQPNLNLLQGIKGTVSTHEDSLALAMLETEFRERKINHAVHLHFDLQDEEKSKHLFLICGPVGNSVTKSFLDESPDFPYGFTYINDHWIIRNQDGRQAHPDKVQNDLDFAIIAKYHNPWSRPESPTNVYIAAGIDGLGTWGAAYYLAKRTSDLQKTLRHEGGSLSASNFAGIISAKKRGRQPPITHLLEITL